MTHTQPPAHVAKATAKTLPPQTVRAVLDPSTGIITVTVCKDSAVNESMGVGIDKARENLGVQCEDGNGYQVRVR